MIFSNSLEMLLYYVATKIFFNVEDGPRNITDIDDLQSNQILICLHTLEYDIQHFLSFNNSLKLLNSYQIDTSLLWSWETIFV